MEGRLQLVYAVSRKLSASEEGYHHTKLEELPVVWCLARRRHYLFRIHFVIVSDCVAVNALSKVAATGQTARWLDKLSELDFEIRHRAGKKMEHADALSRNPVEEAAVVDEEKSLDVLEKGDGHHSRRGSNCHDTSSG